MKAKFSQDELKALHGSEYAFRFEEQQDHRRVEGLLNCITLQPMDNIIDFGCGSGIIMPLVAHKVNSYTGIDFSKPFIKIASEKAQRLAISNAIFTCEDIIDFSRTHEQRFDCALALDISEHVYDQEWITILTAIRSTLVEHGTLYVHTPNLTFFVEQLKDKNFLLKQFPEHIAVRTAEHNVHLLRKAGFSKIEFTYIAHYNVLKYFKLLTYLPLVGKYFNARILIKATK